MPGGRGIAIAELHHSQALGPIVLTPPGDSPEPWIAAVLLRVPFPPYVGQELGEEHMRWRWQRLVIPAHGLRDRCTFRYGLGSAVVDKRVLRRSI